MMLTRHQTSFTLQFAAYSVMMFYLLIVVKPFVAQFTSIPCLSFMMVHVSSKISQVFTLISTVGFLTFPRFPRMYVHMFLEFTSILVTFFTYLAVRCTLWWLFSWLSKGKPLLQSTHLNLFTLLLCLYRCLCSAETVLHVLLHLSQLKKPWASL